MVITDPLRFFTDYTIPIREDGSFRLSVPSFGITHVMITSGAYTGQVLLRPGEETHLVVSFDRTGKKHVKITGKLGLDESDLQLMPEVLGQIMADGQKVDRATFGKLENGGDFIRYCRQYIRTAKDEASRKTALSGPAIEAVQISLTTFLLNQLNFDYYGSMKRSYYNQHHPDRDIEYHEFDYSAPPIDSSYFSFLSEYDLNSPYYLYSSYLQPFFQTILKDKTLAIPDIDRYPLDRWVTLVKDKLRYAIEADTGLFFDLLTANAYIKQITGLKPLTAEQKSDIRGHFMNKAFVRCLIDEDKRTKDLIDENQGSTALTIAETPQVPLDKLLDAIMSRYKGKVVLVDFWATWCVPCLESMEETAPVKKQFREDVAFVYITTTSSPPKVWHEKIKDIGGHHYYLTDEQWDYLLDSFNFSGIPTYMIYDRSGRQKHIHTAFMGTEQLKQWLTELL